MHTVDQVSKVLGRQGVRQIRNKVDKVLVDKVLGR